MMMSGTTSSSTIDLLQKLEHKEMLQILSDGLCCQNCDSLLHTRVLNHLTSKFSERSLSSDNTEEFWSTNTSDVSVSKNDSHSSATNGTPKSIYSTMRKSYASNLSPQSVNSKQPSSTNSRSEVIQNSGANEISEDKKEMAMMAQVGRKKDFVHYERVNERSINVLQGLELHTRVFNAEEQKNIVESVYNLQRMGEKGELRERTYSAPRKWMRGKGRITMQFGCCYNYAVDKNGNPPGIIRDEEVDPLPPMFKQMIKKMIRWQVLPRTCVPNSCIVNIYDEGDCIPPHIDHHDFLRPFCTVSFLTECNILFGSNLKIVGPGVFSGPVSIPLPVGSVLILSGNGANVAKHSVPAVPTKRISITFRKMDDNKLPYRFSPDPDLIGVKPLVSSSLSSNSPNQPIKTQQRQSRYQDKDYSSQIAIDDFPPLGSTSSGNRQRGSGFGLR